MSQGLQNWSSRDDEAADAEWLRQVGASQERRTYSWRLEPASGPVLMEVRKAAQVVLAAEKPIDATLPAVAREVYRLAGDPTVSLECLATTIERDPLMAAHLVALANSAYYRPRSRGIESVKEAAQRVGVDGIRTSIIMPLLGARLVRDEASAQLWSHANEVAAACPFVAGLAGVKPETAHLAGLLHDAGRMITRVDAARLEAQFGTAATKAATAIHEEIGAALLSKWGLPASICEAVGLHHHPPEHPNTDGERLANVVALVDTLVRGLERGVEADPTELPFCAALGLRPTPIRALVARLPELVSEARR